jgi:hypothetical protein
MNEFRLIIGVIFNSNFPETFGRSLRRVHWMPAIPQQLCALRSSTTMEYLFLACRYKLSPYFHQSMISFRLSSHAHKNTSNIVIDKLAPPRRLEVVLVP